MMKRSAFHPFMFPMIFAELERERLLYSLRRKVPDLRQRILDMENRLRHEKEKDMRKLGRRKFRKDHESRPKKSSEKEDPGYTIMEKECEATKLWVWVDMLKAGVEGLITVLQRIDKETRKSLKEVQMLGRVLVPAWLVCSRSRQNAQ
jgi:hypothetical protein